MKYFLRRRFPEHPNVLVIESGTPAIASRAITQLRRSLPDAPLHLITCWPDPPDPRYQTVFRAADYPSTSDKLRLLFSLRKKAPGVLVILCTGESVMSLWKAAAALVMPSKLLVVNENADYFWVDWENRRAVGRFIAIRWGVHQEQFLGTVLRGLVFPFTLLYLLLYALFLYLRRLRRLAQWKFQGTPK